MFVVNSDHFVSLQQLPVNDVCFYLGYKSRNIVESFHDFVEELQLSIMLKFPTIVEAVTYLVERKANNFRILCQLP